MKRLLTRSVRTSKALALRSDKQLNQLSFLQSPQLHELSQIPDQLEKMFSAVSSLPALTPGSTAALTQLPWVDPGKRPWETSKSGYFDWATKQMLAKVKQQISGTGDTTITSLAKHADAIAKSRTAVETSAELSSLFERGAEGE